MPAVKKSNDPKPRTTAKPGRETKTKVTADRVITSDAAEPEAVEVDSADTTPINEPNDMMNQRYAVYVKTCQEAGIEPYVSMQFKTVGDIDKAIDLLVEKRTKPKADKKTKPANSGRAKGEFTPKDRAKLRKLAKDGKLIGLDGKPLPYKWGQAWEMTPDIAALLGRKLEG